MNINEIIWPNLYFKYSFLNSKENVSCILSSSIRIDLRLYGLLSPDKTNTEHKHMPFYFIKYHFFMREDYISPTSWHLNTTQIFREIKRNKTKSFFVQKQTHTGATIDA